MSGPAVGRAIDARGGRRVLLASNLVFIAGLGALALAHGPVALFAAWRLAGGPEGAETDLLAMLRPTLAKLRRPRRVRGARGD